MQIIAKKDMRAGIINNKSKKNTLLGWLLVFIIWPFGAFLGSIKLFRAPEARIVFMLFCVYFGFSFVFQNNYIGSADNARYVQQLAYFHYSGVDFQSLISALYNSDNSYIGSYADVYQPLATWFVSIFTPDPRWLFALFGLVFGYFYSKNIWLLLEYARNNIALFAFLLIMGFALINPIWNINGVRMWTAAQVFIYGSFLFFLKEEKIKGFFWVCSTPLIHFSYLFAVSLFALYLMLPKNISIYFLFFLMTSFLKEIDLFNLNQSLSFLPQVFQDRVDIYANEDIAIALKERGSDYSWHVPFADLSSKIIVYAITVLIFIKKKNIFLSESCAEKLYMYALFFGGFANIAATVPSGGRFLVISKMLFYACFFMIVIINVKIIRPKVLKYMLTFFLMFYIVFQIRTGLDYTGYLAIIGNPIIALFAGDQVPIIRFIKILL